MDTFGTVVGKILPFVTIAVFAVGLWFRIRHWRKAAVGNMALFPFASKSKGEMRREVLGEILFFTSFRKENQLLWWATWAFHVAVGLIVLGHTRLITDWPLRGLLGMSEGAVNTLSATSGGAMGILIQAALLVLFSRRLFIGRVREISSGEDLFLLLLLLSIVMTGNMLRFQNPHFDITVAQTYFASLFTFTAIQVPASPVFLTHFLLVQIMLIYLPFGKLLHIPGIFFSRPLLARDY